MKVTTQNLLKVIEEINHKIDSLQADLVIKAKKIKDLEAENNKLVDANHNTLSQIKEYIKELEVIRNHYVNNQN